MAWTAEARQAAAAARKRRAGATPKATSKTDPNARVKKMYRQAAAEALKWGRNFAKGRVTTKPNPVHSTRAYLNAFMDGIAHVKKMK